MILMNRSKVFSMAGLNCHAVLTAFLCLNRVLRKRAVAVRHNVQSLSVSSRTPADSESQKKSVIPVVIQALQSAV
jgi:hypothetical protein